MSFAAVETGGSTLQPDPDAGDAGADDVVSTDTAPVEDTGGADEGGSVSEAARTLSESRKDRKAERGRLRAQAERDAAERARTERENAELRRSIDGLTKRLGENLDAQERSKPKEEDPRVKEIKTLTERRRIAATRMATDATAYSEWEDIGDQIADLRAEIKADARLEKFREEQKKTAPRPVAPDVQRLATEFTWLTENKDARHATELEIRRLVNKHRRDMSNPKVRFATMREAAANVAAAWDLDPGYSPDSAAAARLSGPGGKLGTVGGGGEIEVARDDDKMAMAKALYPNDDDDTAWRKFSKEVASPIMAAQKKSR